MAQFNIVMQSASILMYCLSMALLIIPHFFIWTFYTLPQSIRFSIKGKIYAKSILPTLIKLLSWIAIVTLLYVIAYIADPAIFADLSYGFLAMFSWGVAILNLLRRIIFERRQFQDEFYEEFYLKFIKPEEQEKYDEYIQRIKTFTLFQVKEESRHHLPYLFNKAVLNRIIFLENNPEEQKRIESAQADNTETQQYQIIWRA